jgi:hypothetical protein
MISMFSIKRFQKWSSLCVPLILLLTLAVGCGSKPDDVPLAEIALDLQVIRLDEALYESVQGLRQDTGMAPQALFTKYFAPSKGFITDWMFGGNDSIATDSLIGDAMAALGHQGGPRRSA